MKKLTLPLAAVTLVAFAGCASAQCSFNIAPAKGVWGSFVRTYAPCPGTEQPVANAQTDGGTDACTPVTPPTVDGQATTYKYDRAKGKCSGTTQAKLVKDCALVEDSSGTPLGLQSGPCHITYVKSKCSGILRSSGDPINGAADDGWQFATLSRASFNDDANGDMTVIDFPVTFAYSIPSGGKIEVDSNSAEALIPLVGANNAELPPCTSSEIVDVVVKAPGGLPFAKLGGATHPKE